MVMTFAALERRWAIRLAGIWLGALGSGLTPACAEPATASLPFSLVDNRPFVSVRVDGQGPFSFILDTGSASTTIGADLARQLHLPALRNETGEGAGEKPLLFHIVHLASTTLGPFSLGAMDAPAMDTTGLDQAIGFQHLDGVLGVEIFIDHVVTLDAARGQIDIRAPEQFHAPAQALAIPFTLDENRMPAVTASIAGISGSFEIDTGDRSSLTLFGSFWRKHKLDRVLAPTVSAMTGYGAGGPILGLVGRSTDFKIGDLQVPPTVTRLSLQHSGAFTRTDRAGSIGMGILKRFVVSFDYSHHTMWLSKGSAFDAPDLYDRAGLWLGLSQGPGLEVMAVTSGGPAAKAGMRVGDVVSRVGRLEATPATLFEIRQCLQSPHLESLPVDASRKGVAYKLHLALHDQIAPLAKISGYQDNCDAFSVAAKIPKG